MQKGGDATKGKLATQYDGPRPDRGIAGTCGGSNVQLEKCVAGNAKQVWGFRKEALVSGGPSGTDCLDIDNYLTKKGSMVWAYPCVGSAKPSLNENWAIGANGTLRSLQPDTPFCVAVKGTIAGSGAILDDCGAASAAFKIGFTKSSGTGVSPPAVVCDFSSVLTDCLWLQTIVQRSSGMCLTFGGEGTPGEQSYQPMQKKGAIILATGGDNSNSAKGNFYEGFMATGVASDATDEAIQANIIAVGYSGFSIPA